MNKFSFNLQSAFIFVGGTRDVIFKMKTRWHEGYEERKKCICCMVRNRVHQTVGNWSGLVRYETGPNSKFKFEFKKIKKIPKNTSNCDESNSVKFFQIFVHLVYFADI